MLKVKSYTSLHLSSTLPTYDISSSIMAKLKAKLGWTKPNADTELFMPLFAVAYEEKMHLLNLGEVATKWKIR